MPAEISNEEIRRAISNSIPIIIKTYKLSHDTELYIEKILGRFLSELGFEKLKNPLSYCLKELAVNAKKANTKRVYFMEKSLKIDSRDDYEEGMKNFKEDTLSNINYYLEKQKERGLYIKVVFRTKKRSFYISVHNNVEITKSEHMRIFDRIARARAYRSITDAFTTVMDVTEGAGLGIIILILMLKKIGLTEDSFEIDVSEGETISRIIVPFSEIHIEKIDLLTEAVVNEINSLPRFPDNILYLQKLTSDPDADFNEIAGRIQADPGLTAEILKMVNSPIYRVAKKIEKISSAIKLIGMRALRNILYSYGTQRILGEKYAMMKEMWDHALRVANYAYNIARNNGKKGDILDDVFIGGILHDLGKIVLSSLHPHVVDKIVKFCIEKGISTNVVEDITVGLNHAETGAKMAEKWNFPDQLIAAIRAHHEPSASPEQFKSVVYPVYLANFICSYEKEKVIFDQMDPDVKRYFKLTSDEMFQELVVRLRNRFDVEEKEQKNSGKRR
ncbi:MAG: HDOD domain-containing protein [Spirochaetales bacterium]|nr:HDOD domain-containing protein [Spirochaetales bacterium]